MSADGDFMNVYNYGYPLLIKPLTSTDENGGLFNSLCVLHFNSQLTRALFYAIMSMAGENTNYKSKTYKEFDIYTNNGGLGKIV